MTVFGGAPVMAAEINEALNRRMGTTLGTSDLTATSGTTEKVMDTLTCALLGGRTYRITAFVAGTSSVALDKFLVRIRNGLTTAGAQLTYSRLYGSATTGNDDVQPFTDFVCPSDGNYDFCTTVTRDAGTGTFTPKGSAGQPRILSVDLATTA